MRREFVLVQNIFCKKIQIKIQLTTYKNKMEHISPMFYNFLSISKTKSNQKFIEYFTFIHITNLEDSFSLMSIKILPKFSTKIKSNQMPQWWVEQFRPLIGWGRSDQVG
jgi:hypothetical protein